MKIYEHKPESLLRISIRKIGEETQYLTICEATAEQFEKFCKDLISKQNLDIFCTEKRTGIDIRSAIGQKNGKTKSISFKGLSPKEVKSLIEKELPKR